MGHLCGVGCEGVGLWITTDQTEFTDSGPLRRDSGFTMKHAQFFKKRCQKFKEAFVKR